MEIKIHKLKVCDFVGVKQTVFGFFVCLDVRICKKRSNCIILHFNTDWLSMSQANGWNSAQITQLRWKGSFLQRLGCV